MSLPVVLMAFYTAVYHFNALMPSLESAKIAAALAAVLGALWVTTKRRPAVPRRVLAIAFIVVSMIAVNEIIRLSGYAATTGNDLMAGRTNLLISWLSVALFFFFALDLGGFANVTKAYLFVSFAAILGSFVQFFVFKDLNPMLGVRLPGLSGYGPNTAMIGYMLVLTLALYHLETARAKAVWLLYYGISATVFFAIVLSGSRGGILSALVLVFVNVALRVRLGRLVVGVILVVAIAAFLLTEPSVRDVLDVLGRRMRFATATGDVRLTLWQDAMAMLSDAPLWAFLVGSGGGSIYASVGNSAHNSYITHAIEYGVPGIAFIVVSLLVFADVLRASDQRISASLGAGLAGFFVFSLTKDAFITESFSAMFVCAVMALKHARAPSPAARGAPALSALPMPATN